MDQTKALQLFANLSPENRQKALNALKADNPEGYEKLVAHLVRHRGFIHEAKGYEHWLRTMGSQSFSRPFAPIQHKFWEWNWYCLQKLRNGQILAPRESAAFLPWSRAVGKSTHVEWACVAEGALLKQGYVIYLCATLKQAIDHVAAIRDRIESEKMAEFYPWLSKPKLGTHGNRFGWGQEFLMTAGGWTIRPIGADVGTRGGKALNLRVTLIVPDDYDELGDSPLVVEGKKNFLTHTVLPMGDPNTRVLVPQNPIHANSVVNQMLTGACGALAQRTVFGEIDEDGTMQPIPAVKGLVYEIRQSDDGPYSVITQGESKWDGISIAEWERTLNFVSPEAFEAEYQHNLSITQEERVLPEYDDRVKRIHVITWSQFEAKYGVRRIPAFWDCNVGLDIGYTVGHRSAWTFLTTAPEGAPLSGSIFRYRGCVFVATTIGDMHVEVKNKVWPKENLVSHLMSHEKLGERLVLNQKHNWHFQPCDSAKTAGLSQWRHFLRPDKTQPHPFHPDRKRHDGLWELGRPAWFDVVDDDQFLHPRDDNGLKVHRDQAFKWRMRPTKVTDSGVTVEQPVKADEDSCDATRMLTVTFPLVKSMTPAQRVQAAIPEDYRRPKLYERADLDSTQKQFSAEMAEMLAKRMLDAKKKPVPSDPFGREL